MHEAAVFLTPEEKHRPVGGNGSALKRVQLFASQPDFLPVVCTQPSETEHTSAAKVRSGYNYRSVGLLVTN